jgi:aromatic-L-amino-acid/L-tryptophan decarboxylase
MPLELSPEDFDPLADRMCQVANEYLADLDGRPSFPATSGTATAEVFERALPEQGVGGAAFDGAAVIADHLRQGNAWFFAYVLGSGEPVAAIGSDTGRPDREAPQETRAPSCRDCSRMAEGVVELGLEAP